MKTKVLILGIFLTLFTMTACTPTQKTRVVHEYKQKTDQISQPWFIEGDKGIHVVANNKITAALLVNDEKIRVSGRSSFHLTSTEAALKDGKLLVKGFNLAFFDVPQHLLAKDIDIEKSNGVLGFTASFKEPQILKYDPVTGKVSGEIKGIIDASYMAKLIKQPVMDGKKGDLFETVTQPANVKVDFIFKAPLTLQEKAEVRNDKGEMDFSLRAHEIKYKNNTINAFELNAIERYPVEYEWINRWYYEVGKRLCIQPVRIGRLTAIESKIWPWEPIQLTFEYTGDGLAFGQPRANSLWAKADVVFNYRDWKTLWKPDYWVVDTVPGNNTSTEQADLKAEVDDADCIEVFFIDEFDPVDWGGAGATWGRGTAGAQIISSDVNADGGVDFTHLAHELGHVMGLIHPGAAGATSSTGTLLCPSGYLNDNPNANSQENKDNIYNPLFTFTFKRKTDGPDCEDSADCGACP